MSLIHPMETQSLFVTAPRKNVDCITVIRYRLSGRDELITTQHTFLTSLLLHALTKTRNKKKFQKTEVLQSYLI
jgi:hypothetical protein